MPDYTAMKDIACRPDSGKMAERVKNVQKPPNT